MLSGNDSTSPSRDSYDRSSTGIRGPYQIPVDDDEREIDVADSIIADLEDGLSFFPTTPPLSAERRDVAIGNSLNIKARETALGRNWLAEHGEA
jgi:hypothetical protein